MLTGRGELRVRRYGALGILEIDETHTGPLQTLHDLVDRHWHTLGPGDTMHLQVLRDGGVRGDG